MEPLELLCKEATEMDNVLMHLQNVKRLEWSTMLGAANLFEPRVKVFPLNILIAWCHLFLRPAPNGPEELKLGFLNVLCKVVDDTKLRLQYVKDILQDVLDTGSKTIWIAGTFHCLFEDRQGIKERGTLKHFFTLLAQHVFGFLVFSDDNPTFHQRHVFPKPIDNQLLVLDLVCARYRSGAPVKGRVGDLLLTCFILAAGVVQDARWVALEVATIRNATFYGEGRKVSEKLFKRYSQYGFQECPALALNLDLFPNSTRHQPTMLFDLHRVRNNFLEVLWVGLDPERKWYASSITPLVPLPDALQLPVLVDTVQMSPCSPVPMMVQRYVFPDLLWQHDDTNATNALFITADDEVQCMELTI